MRQFIIALVIGCFSFVAKAGENETAVPAQTVAAFNSTFPNAENVKWQQTDKFAIASFSTEDHNFYAYYNADGTLAVVAEVISFRELPKSLKKDYSEKMSDQTIKAVYRMEAEGDVKYYIEVEKEGKSSVFNSTGIKWNQVALSK
jgi:hypothetical protein